MSLMRPPQPVAPPLGSELCHCCVWSECEYRLRGSDAGAQRVLGGRLHQRADVEDQRRAVLAVEPLDVGHGRVEAVAGRRRPAAAPPGSAPRRRASCGRRRSGRRSARWCCWRRCRRTGRRRRAPCSRRRACAWAVTMPRRSSCEAMPAAPSAQQLLRNWRRFRLVFTVGSCLVVDLALGGHERQIERRARPFPGVGWPARSAPWP